MYPRFVSFKDSEFASKFLKLYQEEGLCVIQDVFTKEECDLWVSSILKDFESFGTGLDHNDMKSWTTENLPPQTRPGLFQTISNLQVMWDVRTNVKLQEIFKLIYFSLTNETSNDFIVFQ